jgi:hypothetical protein
MPDEKRHESEDLEDYEVRDASDTLDGPPGDDPLDRGVVTPDRWSAAMRFGTTASEQQTGESLDELLAEEEPDEEVDLDEDEDDELQDEGWDENATNADVSRYERDDSPDARAGRLVDKDDDVYPSDDRDFGAHDAGIDGGAATAEEAAVHVVDTEDEDDDDEDDDG